MSVQDVSAMSIYIPRVYNTISKEFIINIFEVLKYGKVKQIDFVDKMDSKGVFYHAAYIHFEYWYENITCKNFQGRVKNPEKEARIVYKEPWYWICLENTSLNIKNKTKEINSGERKMKINLDDLLANTMASKKEKKLDDDEYIKQLELMNYKLMYDLYNIQGDFIMT
jgi:hypothetical protein